MENTNNNKKRFATFSAFKTDKGVYAIAEGNLTRDPSLSASEGKKAFVSTAMGCGDYPISNGARYAGLQIPEGIDIHFANLKLFGKNAELLNEKAKKGDKLVVSGRLEYETRERDGKVFHNLTITVDNFVIRPHMDDSVQSAGISRFTRVYTDKSGTDVCRPMLANFVGTVNSAELYDFNKNDGSVGQRLRVNVHTDKNPKVAYDLATGAKADTDKTNEAGYMNVTMFNKVAVRASKCIRKGAKVAFTGEIRESISEDTGKVYYEMVGTDFVILKWPPKDEAEAESEPVRNNAPAAEASASTQSAEEPDAPEQEFQDFDDDDDELPF